MTSTIQGVGPQLAADDIRGWLTFKTLPDAVQKAEDARQFADWESSRARPRFTRTATPTERALLEHLGYDLTAYGADNELRTHITFFGPLRNRRWPQLEGTNLS